ncbi:hypothetical protein I4U23_016261, partial [Adineta vaga]
MTRFMKVDLTCYNELNCNYRLNFLCLHWTEICDGKIDCLNNGIDEQHCWQLEMNKCKDNEFQCNNGQCIPLEFYHDLVFTRDCLDHSDEGLHVVLSFFGDDFIFCPRLFFSRSCENGRNEVLIQKLYSIENNSISIDCQLAMKCILEVPDNTFKLCKDMCKNDRCKIVIESQCPDFFYFPNISILSVDIYLLYAKYDIIQNYRYPYICFNLVQYQNFSNDVTVIVFNNQTCFRSKKFLKNNNIIQSSTELDFNRILYKVYQFYGSYHLSINSSSIFCREPDMYQCFGSIKCIPAFRFRDKHIDCPYLDDEDIFNKNDYFIKLRPQHEQFKCPMLNKLILKREVNDGYPHCMIERLIYTEDEPNLAIGDKHVLSFQTLCDGYTEIYENLTNNQLITDETECEYWECNNYYTQCDGIWNCPDGQDETDCPSNLKLKCPLNFHACISFVTKQMICLPIEKINNGIIDCYDTFDEPNLCPSDQEVHCTSQSTVEKCISEPCRCLEHMTWSSEISFRPIKNCMVKMDNRSLGFIADFCMNTMWQCL